MSKFEKEIKDVVNNCKDNKPYNMGKSLKQAIDIKINQTKEIIKDKINKGDL